MFSPEEKLLRKSVIVKALLRNRYPFYTYEQVTRRFHGDHGAELDDPIMQTKEMKKVTYWGLGMNVVLTGTKAVLGVLMNSSSVIADVSLLPFSHG